MKTITIELYSFEELTPEAQAKAIEAHADINIWDNWYDNIIEVLTEELNEKGFEDAKIVFSGFYSQGDGASFYAKINIEHFCKSKRLLSIAQEANFRIDKTSYANHYSHEKTRFVEYDEIGMKRHRHINDFLSELSRTIESERYKLSKEIYSRLEKECEYLQSPEAVKESIIANDLHFYQDGSKGL